MLSTEEKLFSWTVMDWCMASVKWESEEWGVASAPFFLFRARGALDSGRVLIPWWVEAFSGACVRLFATPWTVACHIPLSMGFPRQEFWSGCRFLLQEIFPTKGSNPHLLYLCVGRQIVYHWATFTGDGWLDSPWKGHPANSPGHVGLLFGKVVCGSRKECGCKVRQMWSQSQFS